MMILFSFYSLLSYAEEKKDWEYSFIKALNYEEKDDLEKAIQELENSRSLRGGDPVILRELGYCYGKQGNISKAKECYEEVLSLYPGDINSLKNLVLIEKILGNEEKVLEYENRLLM